MNNEVYNYYYYYTEFIVIIKLIFANIKFVQNEHSLSYHI